MPIAVMSALSERCACRSLRPGSSTGLSGSPPASTSARTTSARGRGSKQCCAQARAARRVVGSWQDCQATSLAAALPVQPPAAHLAPPRNIQPCGPQSARRQGSASLGRRQTPAAPAPCPAAAHPWRCGPGPRLRRSTKGGWRVEQRRVGAGLSLVGRPAPAACTTTRTPCPSPSPTLRGKAERARTRLQQRGAAEGPGEGQGVGRHPVGCLQVAQQASCVHRRPVAVRAEQQLGGALQGWVAEAGRAGRLRCRP